MMMSTRKRASTNSSTVANIHSQGVPLTVNMHPAGRSKEITYGTAAATYKQLKNMTTSQTIKKYFPRILFCRHDGGAPHGSSGYLPGLKSAGPELHSSLRSYNSQPCF
eukprot:2319995-Rhodomonas_salina.1